MNIKTDTVIVDHAGFSVSSLEEAIRFWTEAMGFELVRTGEMGGDFLQQVTGVEDPRCRMALVVSPTGFPIELLEYSTASTLGKAPESAGAIGATHLAVTVADIDLVVARVQAQGWNLKGSPRPIEAGPRAGTVVAYVSGPDRITIEVMQPPA
ncbi:MULTISPECIES: VOC family protein [Xanthomonas]|uniref:VOC family protein n=1 Tax=Xanthomonas TaxID=338 RepID=UPI001ADC57BB|nr:MULTISPECIES: VOC family protein [unclassified Xanthomonas]MBO9873706.1 VOC family protein [Xanthomonas sp. D-93]WNH44071.1 VOC family protein [Xanthomonas sp. A6251]